MKKGFLLCIAVFGLLFAGCHSSNDTYGDWEKVAPISGAARVGAVSFKIGDEIYVGLGYDQDNDPVLSFVKTRDGVTWKTAADFPGTGRMGGVAFVLGNKAYVGTGFRPAKGGSDADEFFKDFYCYDSETDSWTKLPDNFGGRERRNAIAFTLTKNGKQVGYIGCGSTNRDKEFLNDYWSFDGATWTSEDSHGRKRNGGTAFVIDDIAYICLGYESQSQLASDMLKFDGTTWSEMYKIVDATDEGFDDDYTTIRRAYAVSFTADQNGETRGYIATGVNGSSLIGNCWEYDPKSDRWDEVNSLPAYMPGRVGAIGYSTGTYGFVTLGGTAIGQANFDDTWRFTPGIDEDDQNDY